MKFDNKMRVELIKTNASDEDVARAAWVSNYGEDARTKEAGRIEGLINFLYTNRHMSPFEHGSFTFFCDVPIFVAREFMRHRTFSYNEVSGRYKELEPKFYVPAQKRPLVQTGKVGAYTFEPGNGEQQREVEETSVYAYECAWTCYQNMLNAGIAREVARNVLPVGIYTQFYATVNPRNLMQFLTLRNDKHALFEIRSVAQQMEEYFEETMPLTYATYARQRELERNPTNILDLSRQEEVAKARNDVTPGYTINISTGDSGGNTKDTVEHIKEELAEPNKRRNI